ERLGLGARGQDDGARLDGVVPVLTLDLDHARTLERAAPHHQRDLVLPEEELDALRHAVGDAAAPLDRLRIIGLEALQPNAEITGALEEVHDLRVAEQGLRGNATPTQAPPPRGTRPHRHRPWARAPRTKPKNHPPPAPSQLPPHRPYASPCQPFRCAPTPARSSLAVIGCRTTSAVAAGAWSG